MTREQSELPLVHSSQLYHGAAQCRILPEILTLFWLCERSELVNISQLFYSFSSFSQNRLLLVELCQIKPKMIRREKQGKNDYIFAKIRQCAQVAKWSDFYVFFPSKRRKRFVLLSWLSSLLRPTTRQTRDRRSFPSTAACFIREEAALAAFATLRARPELVEARAGSQ